MALTFSSDMRMLICLAKDFYDLEDIFSHPRIASGNIDMSDVFPDALIISWDLQTGGVVSAFNLGGPHHLFLETSSMRIACSRDGKMVGLLHRDGSETFISIYDNVSGAFMHDTYCGTTHFYDIWTHEGSLRVATAKSMTITICEVGFSPGATCTEVETASIPEDIIRGTDFESDGLGYPRQIQFLPASDRLALVYVDPTPGVLIWGIRDSKYLLYDLDTKFDPPMTFSSDGWFFACSTREARVLIWRDFHSPRILCNTSNHHPILQSASLSEW